MERRRRRRLPPPGAVGPSRRRSELPRQAHCLDVDPRARTARGQRYRPKHVARWPLAGGRRNLSSRSGWAGIVLRAGGEGSRNGPLPTAARLGTRCPSPMPFQAHVAIPPSEGNIQQSSIPRALAASLRWTPLFAFICSRRRASPGSDVAHTARSRILQAMTSGAAKQSHSDLNRGRCLGALLSFRRVASTYGSMACAGTC